MKKKSIFILSLSVLIPSALLFAILIPKKHVRLDTREKIEMCRGNEYKKGDYTVRLLPSTGNTFGFDIRKGSSVVYLQLTNPFYVTPEGFINQNDAFNVAWWVVEKIKTGRQPSPSDFNEKLEKELSIQHSHNL